MRRSLNLTDILLALALGILALLAIFPFYQTFVVSLSTLSDTGAGHLFLWPRSFDFSSYRYLFGEGLVTRGMLVSVFVTVVGTFVNMIVTTAGAYAISKKTLPGRNAILNGVIFTMFFSGGIIRIRIHDLLAGVEEAVDPSSERIEDKRNRVLLV